MGVGTDCVSRSKGKKALCECCVIVNRKWFMRETKNVCEMVELCGFLVDEFRRCCCVLLMRILAPPADELFVSFYSLSVGF